MDLIQGVIFNLDGVLVSTDSCHKKAWTTLGKEYGFSCDQDTLEKLRGKTRQEALTMLLAGSKRKFSNAELIALATRKSDLYLEAIEQMGQECILPGAQKTVQRLKRRGLRLAVASSSRNAATILERLYIIDAFDAVIDGGMPQKRKPAPDLYLLAAQKLGLPPCECLVVEDDDDGVAAAHAAGMKVMGVGIAAFNPEADYTAENLSEVDLSIVIDNI